MHAEYKASLIVSPCCRPHPQSPLPNDSFPAIIGKIPLKTPIEIKRKEKIDITTEGLLRKSKESARRIAESLVKRDKTQIRICLYRLRTIFYGRFGEKISFRGGEKETGAVLSGVGVGNGEILHCGQEFT